MLEVAAVTPHLAGRDTRPKWSHVFVAPPPGEPRHVAALRTVPPRLLENHCNHLMHLCVFSFVDSN